MLKKKKEKEVEDSCTMGGVGMDKEEKASLRRVAKGKGGV